MALSPGTRLGPYEILSVLGAGGMGEVYRAKDTRLGRTVAIKILPAHLSNNPKLRERFDREAKAISSLSHPHICPLYDVGHQDGIDYLVMEHLEGETLAVRLKKGPLPTDRVLQYAIQITDALDTAHKHGVIHRDLEPGNIMLTKTGAKLLDFGLAKVRAAEAVVGMTAMPTQTTPLTGEGTILGTLQYMAPEQLEGAEADARTDIFALGAVIYEMATGRKAFERKSQASVISAIMTAEPPSISTLQSMAPPPLDHVVRSCLAKDPEKRWQTAHDILLQLQWIAGGGAVSQVSTPADLALLRKRERLGWIAATALLLLAGIGWYWQWRVPLPVDRPLVRLNVNLGPEAVSGPGATTVLSPDGGRLVFLARDLNGKPRLAMRLLNQSQTTPLAGTENAQDPFFSPNGQWLGFFADGKMKKISVQGGAPVVLGDGFGNDRGASWGQDDTIIVSPNPVSDLLRFAAAGGTPRQLKGTMFCYWPQILPGGQAVLVTRATGVDTANVEPFIPEWEAAGPRKDLDLEGPFGEYPACILHAQRVLAPSSLARRNTSGVRGRFQYLGG
jgi:serine/threonine-protein kinase